MKEIIQKQLVSPIISYRFFSYFTKTVYDVDLIKYNEGGVPTDIVIRSGITTLDKRITEGELIPSTGLFAGKDELYYGDLVACRFLEGNPMLLVFWDNGWRVFGVSAEEFKLNVEDSVLHLGNMFEDKELYKAYLDKVDDDDISVSSGVVV